MLLSKFSFVALIFLISQNSQAMFSEKDCLDISFEVSVSHKDKMTFGMAKTKLGIAKVKCEIEVTHEELKFFKNKWKIDVCREPVHIKSGTKGVEVLKKKASCPNKNSADYCDAVVKIKEIIQDDGLIFAPGEKEDLKTDHGRIYCAYQLLGGYLENNRVYSRYSAPTKPMEVSRPMDTTSTPIVIPSSSPLVDPIPPTDKNPAEGSF